MARDVRRGRAKLDLTSWVERNHSRNERMEICDAVANGTMPMKAYTLIHRDAGFLPKMWIAFVRGPMQATSTCHNHLGKRRSLYRKCGECPPNPMRALTLRFRKF